jgi:type I restriction enzyme M protein
MPTTTSTTMTLSEIAALAGVKPSAVANWRDRHSDFPQPADRLTSGPVYDRTAIKDWLKTHRPDMVPSPVAGQTAPMPPPQDKVAFIWSVADLLRGDYKAHDYGKVILPLTVLRRLDCVLEPTKAEVLKQAKGLKAEAKAVVLPKITGFPFYNESPLDFSKLLGDPNQIAAGLRSYISKFSADARETFEAFDFDRQIDYLDKQDLLYLLVQKFASIDLHPNVVKNSEMGSIFEELIRKFSEQSNETAGEHFTPREVVHLMVNLLLGEDDDLLSKGSVIKTILDPACGTGGMLSVSAERLEILNPNGKIVPFGEEVNPETWAICRSDMMIKGEPADQIILGNSFSQDGFEGQHFDYLIANPPFGVEWKKVQAKVQREADTKGFNGRFGAGLPRINDGSFLFLQHMISKMKSPKDGGSRLAIVFNGSPLFTGAAGSGESEIRRWIIENDWLEAVVALPDQLFYNTGISTYLWIVTNRKAPERHGKVQLVDAREYFVKMRKSLGEKRKEISPNQIEEIARLYGEFEEGEKVKIFPNEAFGFVRITVERPLRLRWEVTDETVAAVKALKPVAKLDDTTRVALRAVLQKQHDKSFPDQKSMRALSAQVTALGLAAPVVKAIAGALAVRDEEAPLVLDKDGHPESNPDLRDNENVPLPAVPVSWDEDPTERLATLEYRAAVDHYMRDEVLPYVPDAWVNHEKTKVSYEIPLTRHFYKYVPPRPLAEIDAEIQDLEAEIQRLLAEVAG